MDSSIISLDSVKFDPPGGIVALDSIKFDEGPTLGERALSGAEETGRIAMSLTTPFVAWPVSKMAGGIRSLYSGSAASGDEAEAEAYAKMTEIYHPNTPEGQKLIESIGKVFNVPLSVARDLISLPLESWKATGAAKYIPTALAEFSSYILAGKGIKSTKQRLIDPAIETNKTLGELKKTGSETIDIPKEIIETRKILPLDEIKFDEPVKAVEGKATGAIEGEIVSLESIKFDEPTIASEQAKRIADQQVTDQIRKESAALEDQNLETVDLRTKVEPSAPEIVQPAATSQAAPPDATMTQGATGIKNSVVDSERAAKGLDPIESPTRKLDPENWDKAKAAVDSGEVDPRLLAKSIVEKPRVLLAEEENMILYDKMRLQNEHRAVQSEIEKAVESYDSAAELELIDRRTKIEADLEVIDQATKKAGTEWGLSGKARQQMIEEDYSLAAMLTRAKADKGGAELTPKERAKYESLAKQIEEANAKIKAYEEKASSLASVKAIERIKLDVPKEQRQTKRTYAKQELSLEFDGLVKELNKALGGQLNVGIDPTAVMILAKMAKNRVKAGIITVEGVVDDIHTAIKAMGFDIDKRTIRDAISGYGVTSQMSKDAINVQLRELKHQMRLVSALEDAQAKQVPLRSGLQRDKPSDAVRALERQVKQVMRENGIDSASTKTSEEQWKTALDAVKTRLQNSIADVTKQIETGQRPAKIEGIKYDAEATELKQHRDFLIKVRDALEEKPLEFAIEKPGEIPVKKQRVITPEQRVNAAVKAAERAAGRYAEMVAKGELSPEKKTTPALETPELLDARQRKEEWKEYVKELRAIENPPKTAEEIALQSFKNRTTNRIAELEKKISAGDYTDKPKRELKYDPEALKLRYELDKKIKAYNEAKFQDAWARRSNLQKVGGGVAEGVNLIRALKTSFDLSAVFRQGGLLHMGDPRLLVNSTKGMVKAALSEKGQFAIEESIKNRPNYNLYKEGKLFLSEHGSKLSDMEEQYMSRLSSKVPGVAASQRAYTTNLNVLRADKFDQMVATLSKKGVPPTPAELKIIGNFINVFTGRGSVRGKEAALVGLNTVFFAPRYVLSRFQVLAGQPLWASVGGKGAKARLLVAEEYAKTLAGIGVVLGLGWASGATVELDPRSSDFAKLKYGNVRVDPLAGLSQSTVLLSRLLSGETKTAKMNRVVPIRGEGTPYGVDDSSTVMARFLRSKLSPVVGASVDVITGKDVVGNRFKARDIPEKLLMPLSFNDIYEAMKEQGVPAGTALGLLSIFGIGLQVYNTNDRSSNRSVTDSFFQDVLDEQPGVNRSVRVGRRR